MRNREHLVATADMVVIGGGVAGLAVARELGRRGLHATVLERGTFGAEASHAAAGMLAPQSEADRDDDFFRLQCASRDLYPAFAESLREETGIDIELDRTGTLYLAFTDEDEEELNQRHAWQTDAGLEVERLTTENARALEPSLSPRVRFALKFPLDWQVENRRLVEALTASLKNHGGGAWAGVVATALRVEADRVVGVETSHGYVSAGAVVIAAGAWTSRLPFSHAPGKNHSPVRLTHPGIEPVRGQMLCFNPQPSFLQLMRHGHVVYTRRGYIVPRRDGRLLAGSTTENVGFQKQVTAGGVLSILSYALEIAPAIRDLELLDSWAGLRPKAVDEWPVLGASAEVGGLYYATGHYRNGILLAPITGESMADMIIDNRQSPLLEAFTLERFHPKVYASSGE